MKTTYVHRIPLYQKVVIVGHGGRGLNVNIRGNSQWTALIRGLALTSPLRVGGLIFFARQNHHVAKEDVVIIEDVKWKCSTVGGREKPGRCSQDF